MEVTSTDEGVIGRWVVLVPITDTLSTVTLSTVLRLVVGSDTEGIGSGYGLAQASYSSTVPGSGPGDEAGVASVTRTAGGCDGSASRVPLGC